MVFNLLIVFTNRAIRGKSFPSVYGEKKNKKRKQMKATAVPGTKVSIRSKTYWCNFVTSLSCQKLVIFYFIYHEFLMFFIYLPFINL